MNMTKTMIDELYSAGKESYWDYDMLESDVRRNDVRRTFDVDRALTGLCKAAFKFFDLAARNGHAVAAFKLSKLCSSPDLLCVDNGPLRREELKKQAMEGMVKQAEADPSIAFEAGFAYLYENIPNDIDKAERCFKAGAEAKDASCIWQLGEIATKKGKKIPAYHYYLQAAKLGQGMAMFAVGQCYEKGEGTPKNKAEAIRWYKLCVKSNYAAEWDAKERLKELTKK